MTAENESRNGRDGYDGYDGRTGVDALMAAITGEPLPDETRADAAFMAEHRAAAADVALLREQLGLIGEALAEPDQAQAQAPAQSPEPVPPRRPSRVRRRAFTLAFGTLAVAAVASVVTGLGWLVSQGGDAGLSSGGSADQASSKEAGPDFANPLYLACARLVAEGDVTAVEPLPGTAQERITLRVTRFYQPEKSKEDEVTFLMEEGVVHKGEHILVGIQRHAAAADVWAVGEKDIALERAWITDSLSEAGRPTCE
ncbi:hypothetical protein AB5J49_16615 [Streptomyces sp. R28]|uniref:Anti-sigma factor n=1 Tax=Streptomyces sp. R28 TaxID=3238628 RepID=A0AB39PX64_9ACTN